MSDLGFTEAPASTAWGRYLNREHAARTTYLNVTGRAHHDYLVGPWPDRVTYTEVERTAWMVYYQAGRAAWQQYRREMDGETQPTLADLGQQHSRPNPDPFAALSQKYERVTLDVPVTKEEE